MKKIIKGQKKQLLVLLVVLIGLWTLPLNTIGIVLYILVVSFVSLLYDDVVQKQTPKPLAYLKRAVITVSIIGLVLLLMTWLKGYGWIGLVILVLVFAAFRIYKGRVMFMDTAKYLGSLFKGELPDDEKKDGDG